MSTVNLSAREVALSTRDSFQATPTSLINYQSRGHLLVIGDNEALALCRDWQTPEKLTLINTSSETLPSSSNGVIRLNQRQIEVSGYLGNFNITLEGEMVESQKLSADIVLDLSPEPLIRLEILPPGYFHERIDADNQAALEAQIEDHIGEFEKPKFFNYNASICAHGVNGKVVCTQCIDACPAGAIHSLVESIAVNPNLCQGGGTCASVCPSGAIQYAYPSLADTGKQIQKMLQAYQSADGQQPVILFHAGPYSPQFILQNHDNVLPVLVEELASVGMELCLAALSYGASQVVLMADVEMPNLSFKKLNEQVAWLQSVLGSLGMEKNRVGLLKSEEEFKTMDSNASIKPYDQSLVDNKRNAFFQSLDHLAKHTDNQQVVAELPLGAPFGSALIDEGKCTLCMACVGACPGKALQDGSNRDVPEVFFIESHCLQCGACVQTCPEDAISLTPRLVFDRETRNRSRALNRDTPFGCISCGKPFAPTSVISKMQDRLKDHHMFNSPRALDRLKMCEDCRVADIVQDPEALKGNFDPLN